MGRSSKKDGVADHPYLFPTSELPTADVTPEQDFKSLRHPLWTEQKAQLIQEYLKLFTYVTKHGAYIDGFAAPQRRERLDLCSAKLVLETEPKRIRDVWLCDIDPKGIRQLEEIRDLHKDKGRQRINVIPGDELGYTYAYPYAIHNKRRGGRTMYHMIHATDHPDAPPLMMRAYRRISGRPLPAEQLDLEHLWSDDLAE